MIKLQTALDNKAGGGAKQGRIESALENKVEGPLIWYAQRIMRQSKLLSIPKCFGL